MITGEIKSLNGNKSLLDLSCRNCPATEIVEFYFLVVKFVITTGFVLVK
ncbi:MAG: hypothetical protein CM15mP50_1270 [Rhodobacterales bacterium]|nr:MAG: hypothetical protein CM15mP50_1270 [Rhodobacterales bacterium]